MALMLLRRWRWRLLTACNAGHNEFNWKTIPALAWWLHSFRLRQWLRGRVLRIPKLQALQAQIQVFIQLLMLRSSFPTASKFLASNIFATMRCSLSSLTFHRPLSCSGPRFYWFEFLVVGVWLDIGWWCQWWVILLVLVSAQVVHCFAQASVPGHVAGELWLAWTICGSVFGW